MCWKGLAGDLGCGGRLVGGVGQLEVRDSDSSWLEGVKTEVGEGLGEGGGGGGGVGGERPRQLDGALYAGRQEGDPGRSWSWYRWSYLEQYLHDDAISAML